MISKKSFPIKNGIVGIIIRRRMNRQLAALLLLGFFVFISKKVCFQIFFWKRDEFPWERKEREITLQMSPC